MPGVAIGNLETEVPLPKIKSKGERKGYNLSKDQQELLDIYKKLHEDSGITQAVFAEKLNIGGARLASYLYGRTSGVPEPIIKAARLVAKSPDHVKSKFGGISMQEIMLKWARMLGMKTIIDAKIAPFIGVSISTVCRWRNGDSRPSNVELIRYDAAIRTIADRMNKAAS